MWDPLLRRTCSGKEKPEEKMLRTKARNTNGGMSGLVTSSGGIFGNRGALWSSPQFIIYVTTQSAGLPE